MRTLSVMPAELPGAIERMHGDAKELRRQVKDFQLRMAAQEADALADRAITMGSVNLVATALNGWDAGGLKIIASRIVERPGTSSSSFRSHRQRPLSSRGRPG